MILRRLGLDWIVAYRLLETWINSRLRHAHAITTLIDVFATLGELTYALFVIVRHLSILSNGCDGHLQAEFVTGLYQIGRGLLWLFI